MKNLVHCTLMVAAATVFSGAAYAQDALKANVSFEFRSGKTGMPAGDYRVSRHNGTTVPSYIVMNLAAKKSILVVPRHQIDDRGANSPARLTFNCSPSDCDLAQLWFGDGKGAQLAVPRATTADQERMVSVLLQSVQRVD